MTTGSYSVHVTVDGAAGSGTAVVPVASLATETLGMSGGLGIALVALGALLIAGLLTIVRAGATESVLPPGEPVPAERTRRGRWSVAVAAAIIALVLLGGRGWWKAEEAAYASILFEPIRMNVAAADSTGAVYDLYIPNTGTAARTASRIVPDHGKLMHAFLVMEPSAQGFAHIHPTRVQPGHFRFAPPPLPAGRYRIYADIVRESGFAETLLGEIDLPGPDAAPAAGPPEAGASSEAGDPGRESPVREPDIEPPPRDPDDSWWVGPPAGASSDPVMRWDDDIEVRWIRPDPPIRADHELELRFAVRRPWGEPVPIEPYMGMPSHAVVRRDDGSVFVHLHSNGSVSTAAEQRLAIATMPDAAPDETHTMHTPQASSSGLDTGDVVIPYAFPEPGRYRVWVQIKVSGRVRTAAFDIEVAPG
jgi:hypothetical protein